MATTDAVERSERLLQRAMETPGTAKSDLPDLIDLLGHEQPAVRVNAAWAIGYVVRADPSLVMAVIPRILPYLREPAYRWDVARVLAYLAEEFRDQTKTALVDTATDEERAAINPLLSRLNDEDFSIDPQDVFVLEKVETGYESEDEESEDGPVQPERSHRRFIRDDEDATSEEGADDAGQAESAEESDDAAVLDRDEKLLTRVRRDSSFSSLELLEVVAANDYATVYKIHADDGSAESVIGLKLYGEPVDQDSFRAAFPDRVDRWQQLDDHEHVVSVYDYGREPRPWVAMEFMDGGDLTGFTGRSLRERVGRAGQLIDAVAEAHGHGLVHTGIKPSNVLFSVQLETDVDGLRVADWGMSKAVYATTRDLRHLNPTYAAPEYFDDEHGSIDQFTDVYHLGALLYRLFADRPPFTGALHDVMEKVLTEEPVALSQVRPELPDQLSDVLETALSKEKLHRYETVDHLRTDFERALEGG